MPRYEYWAHADGWQYLVRLDEAGTVTGTCGPLYQPHIPSANRHNYDYDAQPIQAGWIQQHAGEFIRIPDAASAIGPQRGQEGFRT